jgi:alkanesulfonate monooxygenase SsuD/methylene tetrahydromethanopterin reductase-like flavin-dependent oxidoreductase (luciferase family)
MQFGLTLPTGGPCANPRVLVDLAVRAEAAGWDGVFLEDYVVFQGDPMAPTADSFVALAAIATATRRLRIGTKVTPLARRRPWIVARQAATIDHLSEGRMVLGVGTGDVSDHVVGDASFTAFGERLEPLVRAELLDEGLEIIAGLWTGEPFEHRGRHFAIGPVTFLPRPVQAPRIPIWVGGGYPNPGATARAARWDGSVLYRARGQELTPEQLRAIRAAAGDRPYDISVSAPASGDVDADSAKLRALEASGATWCSTYVPVADLAVMRRVVDGGPSSR